MADTPRPAGTPPGNAPKPATRRKPSSTSNNNALDAAMRDMQAAVSSAVNQGKQLSKAAVQQAHATTQLANEVSTIKSEVATSRQTQEATSVQTNDTLNKLVTVVDGLKDAVVQRNTQVALDKIAADQQQLRNDLDRGMTREQVVAIVKEAQTVSAPNSPAPPPNPPAAAATANASGDGRRRNPGNSILGILLAIIGTIVGVVLVLALIFVLWKAIPWTYHYFTDTVAAATQPSGSGSPATQPGGSGSATQPAAAFAGLATHSDMESVKTSIDSLPGKLAEKLSCPQPQPQTTFNTQGLATSQDVQGLKNAVDGLPDKMATVIVEKMKPCIQQPAPVVQASVKPLLTKLLVLSDDNRVKAIYTGVPVSTISVVNGVTRFDRPIHNDMKHHVIVGKVIRAEKAYCEGDIVQTASVTVMNHEVPEHVEIPWCDIFIDPTTRLAYITTLESGQPIWYKVDQNCIISSSPLSVTRVPGQVLEVNPDQCK